MTGAYEEFHVYGELRTSGVQLLYDTVAAVARIRRFPPPETYDWWTREAVVETAHDFLSERDGVARLRQIHMLATDDESFERILHQAIRNHLRSRSRATDRGALMRRVRDVLEHDDRFSVVPVKRGIPRWTLSSTGIPEPFTGQLETLVRAGRTVQDIKMVRWNSSHRRGPTAERESLARLFEEVLRSAGTSLSVRQLADVTAARFNLTDPPLLIGIDDNPREAISARELGPAAQHEASEAALDIWNQLTERERRLLPHLDEPVRVAADRINLGKTQTAVAQARLREILKTALEGHGDVSAVLSRLEQMATIAPDRTEPEDRAF